MKLKKLSAACLAALISTVGLHSFMPESGFNSTAYAAETITGDANGDGKVTALDAAFIARKLAEQKGSELPSNADYNGDKKTTAGDAAAIAFRLANNYNITKMIELTNNEPPAAAFPAAMSCPDRSRHLKRYSMSLLPTLQKDLWPGNA